ncbi:MAG TPA: TadE family protein [Herpetosiphonaceae bacterium]|nr:TadE family protein [Herpetosiphonaceae bacterium]
MILPCAPYRSRTTLRKLFRSLPRTGQSLVEFAFVFPLIVTIFFGVIELGVLFSVYVGLTNSAREGARAGSTYQYQCPPAPDDTPDCRANNPDLQQDVDDGRLPVINQAIDSTLHPLIDPSDLVRPTPFPTYMPDPSTNVYRYGDLLTVELSYQHQLFFDLFGGPTLTLGSSSTMRIEPGGR